MWSCVRACVCERRVHHITTFIRAMYNASQRSISSPASRQPVSFGGYFFPWEGVHIHLFHEVQTIASFFFVFLKISHLLISTEWFGRIPLPRHQAAREVDNRSWALIGRWPLMLECCHWLPGWRGSVTVTMKPLNRPSGPISSRPHQNPAVSPRLEGAVA